MNKTPAMEHEASIKGDFALDAFDTPPSTSFYCLQLPQLPALFAELPSQNPHSRFQRSCWALGQHSGRGFAESSLAVLLKAEQADHGHCFPSQRHFAQDPVRAPFLILLILLDSTVGLAPALCSPRHAGGAGKPYRPASAARQLLAGSGVQSCCVFGRRSFAVREPCRLGA